MSAAEDKQNDEPRPSGIGPGERLQAARIQQGLSLEDVANRMHLSVNILEAIEENDFEEITAPIFVKGYLRAYARIVTIDEDEMIEQYNGFYSGEDPPISSTSNTIPELSVADARIKWTTYLVIAVLLVLLAAWWWNRQSTDDDPISLDTNATDQQLAEQADVAGSSTIEAASEQAPENSVIETDAGSDAVEVPVDSEPVSTVAVEAEADTAAAEDGDPVEETGSVEVTEAAPAASVSGAEASAGDTEADAQQVAQASQSLATRSGSVQSAPTGSDRLDIVVNADTWADIKDSTNFQLVYDLLRAERLVELTGTAPFSVFLGNGHGVEIVFNGVEVDIAPRVRDDNTARLEIGG